MLQVENITKIYKTSQKRHIVFENVSFTLKKGDRLGLIGSNGAGKSTLLRLLCGIEAPNKGRIIRTSTLSWPVGLTNGFIPQLTGKENVKFICRLMGCTNKKQKETIDFVKEFSELDEYFDMPVSTYSSGMTSRLAYGMSMAFDFDFYIIDEALSVGDDKFNKKSIATFKERSQNKGLIMVSHDMATIQTYCTQVLYLTKGNFHHSFDVDKIIERYIMDSNC